MGTERVESQGHFEMLWDCDFCETKGLLAKSQRFCPECSAPQSAVKRYFPNAEQQKRVDGHVYEGSDRQCPACNAPMGAKAKSCTQCGAPLDGSKRVEPVKQAAPAPKKRRRIWPYILIGIAVVGFAIWFFFIRTKDAQLEVAAHRWERSIAIEEFRELQESAWHNEVAKDAIGVTCRKKERSKKKVADGEDCRIEKVDKGDGTFEQLNKCTPKYRSEPVEEDWCSYTVRRWKKIDDKVAKGDGMTPAWPAGPDLPPASPPQVLGARRSGPRTEKLVVDFGKGKSCAVSEAMWKKLADGQKVKIEVRARSEELLCDTIKPK